MSKIRNVKAIGGLGRKSNVQGSATFDNDEDVSLSPSFSYSSNNDDRKYNDGVSVSNKSKQLDLNVDGKFKVNEAIVPAGFIIFS